MDTGRAPGWRWDRFCPRPRSPRPACASTRKGFPSPSARFRAAGPRRGRARQSNPHHQGGPRGYQQHQPGRAHRQPDRRSGAASLPSGTSVCRLRVAVNTRRKGSASGEYVDKPNYFDVVVWGAQGEACARYLAKGRPDRDRRSPRVARVAGRRRRQAPGGRGHRRCRPVPRRPPARRGRRRGAGRGCGRRNLLRIMSAPRPPWPGRAPGRSPVGCGRRTWQRPKPPA